MIHKKLLWSLLAIIVMWSCGKDDDPAPPAPTAAPTIANFTPESGPVGTEITINGTNFSTTVASNTVKIGSATATVTAATATQLKATVPTGATTAKVTVTVGGNTATSTKDFTVTVPNEDDPNGDDPNGDDPNGDDPDGDDPDGDDPTNEAPTAEDQSFEVAEDVAEGEVIGTVEANDGDGDELTFALVTDESELFQVAENGEITLAEGKNLDFETATEHSLTLSVSDGSNDPAEFTVTIKVTDVLDDLANDPASFILKFNVVAGQELVIGVNTDYSLDYDYDIDWGDDTPIESYSGQNNPKHVYATEGDYIVAIRGAFPALDMKQIGVSDSSRESLVDIVQWGTGTWKVLRDAFGDCTNLKEFSATDKPNLSEIIDMAFMFFGASSFNGDVSNWDISAATDLSYMFFYAEAFNQPLNWNTSNVTDMSYMFFGATAFNQDISNWDTSNVTNMSGMFTVEQGESAFNQPLVQTEGGWNTSNVTDMSNMFHGATNFNQSLASWDISSVSITGMTDMLDNCGMSTENYSATLIGWGSQGNIFIPNNITLGATGLSFCSNNDDAVYFRNVALIGNNGWTIQDAGGVNCP